MATNNLLLFPAILTILVALPSTAKSSTAAVDFIEARCNVTSHRDMCVYSLSPYNATINNNPFLLARIALNISLHGMRNLTGDLTELIKSNSTTAEDSQVMHDCSNYLRNALEEIQSAARVVGGMDQRTKGTELASLVKEANARLRSAVRFQDTCEDAADDADINGVVFVIQVRVKWMMQYTSNANDLVTALVRVTW